MYWYVCNSIICTRVAFMEIRPMFSSTSKGLYYLKAYPLGLHHYRALQGAYNYCCQHIHNT
jgi:hypothetical protein